MEKIEISPEIKEAETKKGIVKIGFDEPKKVKERKKYTKKIFKKLPEISEKEAIQTIKAEEKSIPKPFVSEISEEKTIENQENLEKLEIADLDNLKKEIKAKEILLNLMKKEQIITEKIKKKELKKKLKSEKRAKRKEKWGKRIPFRWFKRKQKIEEIVKEENPNEFKLIETNDTIPRLCPLCSAKIKKQKVNQENGIYKQLFKCKKCNYTKTITISI